MNRPSFGAMPALGGALLLLVAGAALASCPSSDWLATADGECYLPLVPPIRTMDADEAVQACRFYGSGVSLPQIYSPANQERVHLLTGGNSAWLGLRRANITSPWLWPGGLQTGYTNWAKYYPSDDADDNCVYMNYDGLWESDRCDGYNYFVICYCQSETCSAE